MDLAEANEVDNQIAKGYDRMPQEADLFAEALARESIAEEPW